MGKLFSFFANAKSKEDRQKQKDVLDNISNNECIQWKQPRHRLTITEAAEAAQRLSVYDEEPQDTDERAKYERDQKKLEEAIYVIKENYHDENKNEIECAYEKAVSASNNYSILVTNESEEKEAKFDHNEADHNEDEKQIQRIEKKHRKNAKRKRSSRFLNKELIYSGIRFQIDQCHSFKHDPWILDKNRNAKDQDIIKKTDFVTDIDEYQKNRRVTLSNSHNFLWFTTAIQSCLDDILDDEVALTRSDLDKQLDLLPIPFRERIWQMTKDIETELVYPDDYAEFVDCLLLATGQFDIDDDMEDLGFEIRDMTEVFCSIVDVDAIFSVKCNVSRWSKSTRCLSTKGAIEIIKAARNIKSESKVEFTASDDMTIALFTGFTRKAIKHAMTFCTQIFWKVLTDIWWDEDDAEDMALPCSFDKYNTETLTRQKSSTHSRSRTVTKMSETQKLSICAASLEVLFPDLVLFEEDEDDDVQFTQYLSVVE